MIKTPDPNDNPGPAVPISQDVMRWPEFRALAERLGVDLDLPLVRVNLDLQLDELPKVYLEYFGMDLDANL